MAGQDFNDMKDVFNGALDRVDSSLKSVMKTTEFVPAYVKKQQANADAASGKTAANVSVWNSGNYVNPSSKNLNGWIMAIIGICFLVLGLFTALGTALISIFFSAKGLVIVDLIFWIAGAVLTVLGLKTVGQMKRYKKYVEVIGNKEYCEIEDLAKKTSQSKAQTVKDLKALLGMKMFLHGKMDRQETCLMVTEDAFTHYQNAQQQLEARQQQVATEQAAQQAVQAQLSPEVQKILADGKDYIQKIRKSNDAIPGQEVSDKITKLEMITDKIFKRVEEKPDLASDLKKFMNYYLPTTVKLLDTYQELDSQPVQGDNIVAAKKEIENTLDIINTAFRKLLDSFYQDTAWDVSTDSSVLQTMFAQEGLSEDDLQKDIKAQKAQEQQKEQGPTLESVQSQIKEKEHA